MNRLIITLLLFIIYVHATSQIIINSETQKSMLYDNASIYKFNVRICELVKSSGCVKPNDSIYIYNIFHYNITRKINKADLLDCNLTDKMLLIPDYQTFKGYINSSAIILNSRKIFIGVSEPNYFYCANKYNKTSFEMEKFLIEKKDEFHIQFFFDFQDGISLYVMYGKSIDGKIYVFYENKKGEFNVLPVVEFLEISQ